MADDDAGGGDKDLDHMLAAWIQSKGMDRIAAYVDRGRRLANLHLDVLKTEWIRAHRHWYSNWGDDKAQREAGDADAELQIRQQPPPFEAVATDMDRLRNEARALADEIRARPVDWEASGEAVEAELHTFLSQKRNKAH